MSEERKAFDCGCRLNELLQCHEVEGCRLGLGPTQAARRSAAATPINDDLKATSGPLLELDVLLAKFHDAVWNAAADETGKIAYDEAGVAECKAIQRHVRAMLAGESNACPHGVDDGACKQCYADAAGRGAVVEVIREYFGGRDHWDFKILDKSLKHGTLLYASPICDPRAQIETEQRRKMQERFAQRPLSGATADFDLPEPNDAIGDNGAKVAELEKENFALAAGQCVHKGGVMMDEYGHALCPLTNTDDAQPAESKRVELSVGDLQAIESLLIGSGYVGTMSRVRALLARAQAKGE